MEIIWVMYAQMELNSLAWSFFKFILSGTVQEDKVYLFFIQSLWQICITSPWLGFSKKQKTEQIQTQNGKLWVQPLYLVS